jgi:hypothetical protein
MARIEKLQKVEGFTAPDFTDQNVCALDGQGNWA